MPSIFRFALLALIGALLTAYAGFHELSGRVAGEPFNRLIQSTPMLAELLSFPPGIILAITGLTMLAVAIYRLRTFWIMRRFIGQRRPVPALNERDPRRSFAPQHDSVDVDYESEEYRPDADYGRSPHDRYRNNGRYESRGIENYR